MYCASTPLIRAQRFFEVCQEELPDQIANNDRELTKYIRKQLEISYPMMLKVYRSLRKPEDPTIQDGWIISDEDKLQAIYDELYEQYLDEIFGNQSKVSKNEFIELMKGKGKPWL